MSSPNTGPVMSATPGTCDFDHPHPEHPCAKQIIEGVTCCIYCGNLDGDPACRCWRPATESDVDALFAEAWGIARIDGSDASGG